MGRKLTQRITAIIAAVCVLVAACLLGGCVDVNNKKAQKYMIEYMEGIPVTCVEYKLRECNESIHKSYAGFGDGSSIASIIIDGEVKIIGIKYNDIKNYTLTLDEETININEEFMAEKSSEYVEISKMWFKYNDNMENYCDCMPEYSIVEYDSRLFIITGFRKGGGAWWFSYHGSMPACLFKYDIENDTVLYAGCLINDRMGGEYRIVKIEQP